MMGMDEDRFWHSTSRTVKPYVERYRREQYRIDRICHMMGAYVYEAVGVVVGNALSKRGSTKVSYPDKPHLAAAENEDRFEKMTEEERLGEVEKIFAMLQRGGE